MRKIVSIITALIMVFTLSFPALAVETNKLTYDERVSTIKETYGITFGSAKYYDTGNQYKTFAIDVTEATLSSYLGSNTVKTIAKHWIKKNGTFSVRYGTDSQSVWKSIKNNGISVFHGSANNGRITFLSENEVFSDLKDKYKIVNCEILAHEFGHAYDDGILGGAGAAAIEKYNKDNNANELVKGGAVEEFAYLFGWMVTGESIKDSHLPRIDYSKEKCGIIYKLMIRDFGEESLSVKRAAKFLGLDTKDK